MSLWATPRAVAVAAAPVPAVPCSVEMVRDPVSRVPYLFRGGHLLTLAAHSSRVLHGTLVDIPHLGIRVLGLSRFTIEPKYIHDRINRLGGGLLMDEEQHLWSGELMAVNPESDPAGGLIINANDVSDDYETFWRRQEIAPPNDLNLLRTVLAGDLAMMASPLLEMNLESRSDSPVSLFGGLSELVNEVKRSVITSDYAYVHARASAGLHRLTLCLKENHPEEAIRYFNEVPSRRTVLQHFLRWYLNDGVKVTQARRVLHALSHYEELPGVAKAAEELYWELGFPPRREVVNGPPHMPSKPEDQVIADSVDLIFAGSIPQYDIYHQELRQD